MSKWSKAPTHIAQEDWDRLHDEYEALPQKRRYRGICWVCKKYRMLRYYIKDMPAECQWCKAHETWTYREIRRLRKQIGMDVA